MVNKKFVTIFSLICLFVLPAVVLAEETLTILTYYPAPYGVYKDLNITNSIRFKNASGKGISWDYLAWQDNARIWLDGRFDLKIAAHVNIYFYTNHLNIGEQGKKGQISWDYIWFSPRGTASDFYMKSRHPERDYCNIGIGTVNPRRKFHQEGGKFLVYSNSGSWGQLQLANPNASEVTTVYAAGVTAINEDGTLSSTDNSYIWAFGPGSYGTTPDKFNIGSPGIGGVALSISAPSGRVGIGTTTPQTKMHIWSGEVGAGAQEVLRLEGNWQGPPPTGPLLRFTNRENSGTNPNSREYNVAGIAGLDDNTNWGGSLAFYTVPVGTVGGGNLTERMRILHNGRVGIGTTTPSHQFQIGPSFTGSGGIAFESSSSPISSVLRFGDNTGWKFHIGRGRESSPGAINTGTTGVLMTVQDNGRVGIGTTTPSYKLTVNGDAWCTSGSWSGSDLRWKENIETLPNPLEKLLKLRGVSFDWNRKEFPANNFSEGRQIGIIAQEMEKEFPELVTTDKEGYKAIAYDRFTAVLLEAFKAQAEEIKTLKRQLNDLKAGQKEIENLKL